MKLSQLKKKYPKGFTLFELQFDKWYNAYIDYELDVRDEWADITDFMDKRGIYLNIHILSDGTFRSYCVVNSDYKYKGVLDIYNKSRKEAETKAIEKAFEILESRL